MILVEKEYRNKMKPRGGNRVNKGVIAIYDG